jgi:hypothetical protein
MTSSTNLFTYDTVYSYNDECMCYDTVTLTKPIGGFTAGSKFAEVLVNMHTRKFKFNTGDNIAVVQFNFDILEDTIVVKKEEDSDSDFEDDTDADDTDADDTDEDTDNEAN